MSSPLAPAARPMTLADELVMNTEARSAFYAGLIEGKYGAIAASRHRSGGASPLSRQEASQPSGRSSHIAAMLERCDFCGCSVHACGCEEAFEYEQVRDNPTLIAR
jgi:hypothetical protein